MITISNKDAEFLRDLCLRAPIKQLATGTDKDRNVYRALKRISSNLTKKINEKK